MVGLYSNHHGGLPLEGGGNVSAASAQGNLAVFLGRTVWYLRKVENLTLVELSLLSAVPTEKITAFEKGSFELAFSDLCLLGQVLNFDAGELLLFADQLVRSLE